MAKFKKGQSGNPAGRKLGSVSSGLRLLREAAGEIMPLVIQRAKAGDAEAQRLILDRAVPKLRPVSPSEAVLLPDGNFVDQVRALLRVVAVGELSPTTAAEIANIIALAAKVEEVDSLRDEMSALKAVLEARRKRNGKRT